MKPVPLSFVVPASAPSQPRVSPDHKTLTFLLGGHIKVINIDGWSFDAAASLTSSLPCSAGTEMGGSAHSWSADGKSIIFISNGKPYIVPAAGGVPTPLPVLANTLFYAPAPMSNKVAFCVEDDKHIGLCSLTLHADEWPGA